MLKESPEEYLKKDRKECQVRTEFYPLHFGSAVDSCNPRSLQGIVCYRQNHLQKENLKISFMNIVIMKRLQKGQAVKKMWVEWMGILKSHKNLKKLGISSRQTQMREICASVIQMIHRHAGLFT